MVFRDPRLAITDEITLLGKREGAYGLLCSQRIYDLLELRAVMQAGETPIMNTTPVAVDRTLGPNQWKFVNQAEWLTGSKNR